MPMLPDGARATPVDLFDDAPDPPLPVYSAALAADECAPWLRLMLTEGIGPVAALRLLARFGLPDRLFPADGGNGAGIDTRALRAELGPTLAATLLKPDERRDTLVRRCVEWADPSASPPRHLLALVDPRYPRRLLDLHDPPLVLFVLGNPACLARPSIAIVGSRQASRAGLMHAETFARSLSRRGWTIASGLAAGIDTAAHRGALAELAASAEEPSPQQAVRDKTAPRGARTRRSLHLDADDGRAREPGATFAVVGNGLDLVYPAANRALADRIATHGAVVGELPLGTPPLPAHFPRRNRLIAALSVGVIVVEAAQRSGSLITARLAAELGRDVFALPGSIDAPLARGCHTLIKQGAKLVDTLDDVLDELLPLDGAAAAAPSTPAPSTPAPSTPAPSTPAPPTPAPPTPTPPTPTPPTPTPPTPTPPTPTPPTPAPPDPASPAPTEPLPIDTADVLLDALGWSPMDVETLARAACLSADRLGATLLLLELDGQVERLADGRYQRMPGRPGLPAEKLPN